MTWRASSSSRLKRRSISCFGHRIAHHLRPDDLQRDDDFEFLVPRLIDGAHAADAEQLDDGVAAEGVADGEGARARRSLAGPASRRSDSRRVSIHRQCRWGAYDRRIGGGRVRRWTKTSRIGVGPSR